MALRSGTRQEMLDGEQRGTVLTSEFWASVGVVEAA